MTVQRPPRPKFDVLTLAAAPVAWLAYRWGRVVGAYSRMAFDPATQPVVGLEHLPDEPRIFATWHGQGLLSLRGHSAFSRPSPALLSRGYTLRRGRAFVPKGIRGVAMRGWIHGAGCRAVTTVLDENAAAGALKEMVRYLQSGEDALVAVDGPVGPAFRVRPGALFLSRLSGCPIVPTGMAARPAVHYPRWDRLLVPFPRAAIATVVGEPLSVGRRDDLGDDLMQELGRRIDAATAQAWSVVNAPGELTPTDDVEASRV